MAEALIGGILDAGLAEAGDVRVGEPLQERRDVPPRQTYGLPTSADNVGVVDGADIVVIAVKPQNLSGVMSELEGGTWEPAATVVSIVAGATMDDACVNGLGHQAVIRVMPNTPSQIRRRHERVDRGTRRCRRPHANGDAGRCSHTLGEEVQVYDEKLIDMATALSASGPAYVFMFIEALIDAGVYMGMSRDVARSLALQTVLGSTRLVKESGRHPAELKDMVTSPGGTTIEAALALERSGFRASVIDAVVAAYDKSVALGNPK